MNNDQKFLKAAYEAAGNSQCEQRKVGCVIVQDDCIVSSGCNNIKGHTYDCKAGECQKDNKRRCLMVIHAEQNAIMEALNKGIDLGKCTLYVNLSPCLPCSRIIYGFGIKKIVYGESFAEYKGYPQDDGLLFLRKLNIETRQVKLD